MVYWMIFGAVLSRFIPHVPQFSPVFGALLLGGAHLRKRDSVWFPVLMLGASNVALTIFVYRMKIDWTELIQMAAFASIAMTGWMLRRRLNVLRFGIACFVGPTAFYLISNFGVWLGFHTYPINWAGLMACYLAGIPFYGRSLVSTVVFGGMLFAWRQAYAARSGREHSRAIAG